MSLYIIFGFIVVIALLDIYKLVKHEYTLVCAFKEIINYYAFLLLATAPILIGIGFTLVIIGCQEAVKKSSNELIPAICAGVEVTVMGIIVSFIIYVILATIRFLRTKKDLEYFGWIEKVYINGALKYTEEEKAYIQKRDKEAKDKLIARFPFMRVLWKKESKDGTP